MERPEYAHSLVSVDKVNASLCYIVLREPSVRASDVMNNGVCFCGIYVTSCHCLGKSLPINGFGLRR